MSEPDTKLTTLGHLRMTAEAIDDNFIDNDELAVVQETNEAQFSEVRQELQETADAINTKLNAKVSVDVSLNTLIFTTST